MKRHAFSSSIAALALGARAQVPAGERHEDMAAVALAVEERHALEDLRARHAEHQRPEGEPGLRKGRGGGKREQQQRQCFFHDCILPAPGALCRPAPGEADRYCCFLRGSSAGLT